MIDTETMFRIEKVAESRLSKTDLNNIVFGRTFGDYMFVADYANGEWGDFRIEPYQNLSISPALATLHYAQSIFEGLKAYKSKTTNDILVFRPDENAKRFNKSAERMCMPTLPDGLFEDALRQLINLDRAWVPAADGTSLYIRPFMYAADEFIGVRPSETYKFIIFTSPAGVYYSVPLNVKIEEYYVRAAEGGTGAAKCAGNYAASLYPAKLAQEQGYHQLLWTDARDHRYIEESGTMNVMFVINNTLLTAPTSETILDGITRKSVLQMAREMGIKVEERRPEVAELIAAAENGTLQEAFGAGTAVTIAHIAKISYQGKDYVLPPIEKRDIANRLLKELEDIRRGAKPDTRGWVMSI